jgi:hypothetical protein
MTSIDSDPGPSPPFSRRTGILLLVALTLFGAGLRWPALHGDLWMDEIWSYRLAEAEPTAIGLLTNQTWANNHLLNTLWLRGLTEGAPEIVFRLPAFLCGVLAIPLAAWVLRRWRAGGTASLFGAVLVALSFFQIQYSTEARGYAGALVCALVALGLRFGSGATETLWFRVCAFAVVQVLGMLWHPGYVLFAASLAMAQAVTVAASKDSRGRLIGEFLCWQTLPGLALAAYHIVFLSKLRYGAAGYQEPIRPMIEAAGWTLNLMWLPWGGLLAAILLALGFSLGLRQIPRRQSELAIALTLACVVLPTALFFLHPPHVTGKPSLLVLFPRYFHLPFGLALLPMAWGIAGLPRARATMLALTVLLGSGLAVLLPPFYRYGRTGSSQVLEYLAGREEARPIRLGTNELTRGMLQFGFYARRLGLADRFAWVEPEYWLVNPPQYMLSLAPGGLPERLNPPTIQGKNQEIAYELDRVFPHAGASGFHCVVFRRKLGSGQFP